MEKILQIRDAVLRPGFTQIPNQVLRDNKLSSDAKILYALLLSYAWQQGYCYPGQETLAKDMECNIRTAQRYLTALQQRGLIASERRGLTKTNIYFIEELSKVYSENDTAGLSARDTAPQPSRDKDRMSYKEYSVEEYSFNNTQDMGEPFKKAPHPPKIKDLNKYPPEFIPLRKEVFKGIKERRGYSSRQPAAEAKAISDMLLEQLTPDQILIAYDKMKAQLFYQDKNLSLMSVKKDIHEVLKTGNGGVTKYAGMVK